MSDNGAAQSNSGGDQGQQAGAQNDSTQAVDYGEILRQTQGELARSGKTVEALRSELDKTQGEWNRVRQAFTGDQGEKLSPYQKRLQEYDEFANYLKEEKVSDQYPITGQISEKLLQMGRDSETRAENLERELSEIKQQLKRQSNPAYQGLERAAYIMEGMVDEALSSMYGPDANSKGIRAAQFNAVTARINEEIKDLMHNDPEALLKVQRNPKIMRNMVNHFMAEMLPPKVREKMDEERLMNEPTSPQELMSAFAEAREALHEAQEKGDAKRADYLSNLMTDIRRDILAHQFGGKKGDRQSINQLMSGMVGGR